MGGFKPGQYVRLRGLSSAAYNGKLAKVSSPIDDGGQHLIELHEDEVASTSLNREIRIKPENMAHACNCCHKADVAKMQFCGKCKMAAYCNVECQRNDWKRHKAEDCERLGTTREFTKSPLMLAAGMGRLAEVQRLVERGADVNLTASDGTTALYMAAQNGNLSMVQYLVQRGAGKEQVYKDGGTPLLVAVQYGYLAIVRYLAQQGADKERVRNDGATPLLIAAYKGNLAIVQCLVQRGADKDKANNVDGCTPIYIAAQEGHLSVVQYLVQQGAEQG
jgi:hypothetical protein